MSFLSRVEGDDEFQRALRVIAAEKGIAASTLIRAALETAYKAELENVRVFFKTAAYNSTQPAKTGRKKKAGAR
jgi:plasmid stability protein